MGALQQFALDLRKLREDAGSPKFLQMARRSGKSRTALSEASGGDHLPTWETVSAYVSACGEDPDPWLPRWEAVREELKERRVDKPAETTTPVRELADTPPRPKKRIRRSLIGLAAVCAVVALVVLVFSDGPFGDGTPPAAPAVLTVQNKIALGPRGLVEDSTSAYLSKRTIARCGAYGCKIDGTEFWSGAVLAVRCYARGTLMHNFDLTQSGARQNPDAVESDIWYRTAMPDGRTGWLSEIYVEPANRGGMGLPVCDGLAAEGVEVR
ncbi:hypothetical protein BS329_18090 [Amycolatopsis coloradensis]|uniref:HTH cro/C1-type domain-containing protein n=1 Tax=Amycolatopsis coloradensis TaxID=76021 RepID=A0A1R0KT44_9PSEU|nr:hypothetical protein BS329_18090 [Amycolatopsis coloradensis]